MAKKTTAPAEPVANELDSLRKQLVLARMDLRMGRVKNTNILPKLKRQIARILTAQQMQKQGAEK